AFLPRFGDLVPSQIDPFYLVRAVRRTQLVALSLQLRIPLRRETIAELAHVPCADAGLYVEEDVARARDERVRVEAAVHLPDVSDPAFHVRNLGRLRNGSGAHARRGG